MDTKDNPEVEPVVAEGASGAEHGEPGVKSRKPWVALVIFAVVVTLTAWISMVYDEYVSFASALTGLAASVAGAILVGKGAWRSLAITSAIGAGVLALVFGLLWGALSLLMKQG